MSDLSKLSNSELSALLESCSQSADFHAMGHIAPAIREAASRLQAPAVAEEPVAWARKWFVEGEKPYKARNENGRMAWVKKFTFREVTASKVFADDVPLYCSSARRTGGSE